MVLDGNNPSSGYRVLNSEYTQDLHAVRVTINGFNRYMGSTQFRGLPWIEAIAKSVTHTLEYSIDEHFSIHTTLISLDYKCCISIGTTKSLQYTINTPHQSTKSLQYNIYYTHSSIIEPLLYKVIHDITYQRGLSYSIFNSVVHTLAYSVQSYRVSTHPLQYAITSTVSPHGSITVDKIVNGGFETGDFTGWEDIGPGYSVSADAARTGSYGCKLVKVTSDPYIYQYNISSIFDTISIWIKRVTAGTCTFYLEIETSTTEYDWEGYDISDTDGWVHLTWTKAEINTLFGWTDESWGDSFALEPNVSGANGTIYIDDIVVSSVVPSTQFDICYDILGTGVSRHTIDTTLEYNISPVLKLPLTYDIAQFAYSLQYTIIRTHCITHPTQTTETFTSDTTWTPPGTIELLEYLVVGGGGGSGWNGGGGGGAGAVRQGTLAFVVDPQPVVVGPGGASRASGSDSQLGSITSKGGGRGGSGNYENAENGGSGGGSGWQTANGYAIDPKYGHDGAYYSFPHAGGGGGAGTAGRSDQYGGDGVVGSITGEYYGGGGGGSSWGSGSYDCPGGLGGGGHGTGTLGLATPGEDGRGGGGGGGGYYNVGERGGNGIVIIRYNDLFTLGYTISISQPPSQLSLTYEIVLGTIIIPESLQYSIRTSPKIYKTLNYTIYSTKVPIQYDLTYAMCDGLILQPLTYLINRTPTKSTKSLQYIVPHIEITASKTSDEQVPTNIEFWTTIETDILSSWTWTWDFDGDSGSTTAATSNVTHQFLDYGEYDVTCTAATLTGGASDTIHISIVERTLPYIEFYSYTRPGTLTVEFYNYNSNALTYDWDFGDGTAHSSETNPVHTYAIDAVYDVILTATNGVGSDDLTKEVRFTYDPPVADFELEYTPSGTTYAYDVTLTVTDTVGRTDTTTKTVSIVYGPFTRFKDLSTGKIKHWEWDFGDALDD
jgi:PKD repeat protein